MSTAPAALCLSLLLVCPALAEARPASPGHSLDLRTAINRALTLDPQVLSSLINVDRGKLAVLRSQLDRVSLKVDASLSEQWSAVGILGQGDAGGGVSTQGSGAVSLSANLQVPVFTGFRITAAVDRAKLLRDAAQTTRRASARSVALDVLRAYWSIRRLELQRTVSEQALARYAEALAVVKARVTGGLAPPVDINRMEARRLRELARRDDLDGNAAEARAQLAVALELGGAELALTEPAEIPAAPLGGGFGSGPGALLNLGHAEALKWLILSSEQGEITAKRTLDELRPNINALFLLEAQKRAREFQKKPAAPQ